MESLRGSLSHLGHRWCCQEERTLRTGSLVGSGWKLCGKCRKTAQDSVWSDIRLGQTKGGLTGRSPGRPQVAGVSKERTEAAPGFPPTEVKKSGLEVGDLVRKWSEACGAMEGTSSRQSWTDAISSVELKSKCVESEDSLQELVLSFRCVGSQDGTQVISSVTGIFTYQAVLLALGRTNMGTRECYM